MLPGRLVGADARTWLQQLAAGGPRKVTRQSTEPVKVTGQAAVAEKPDISLRPRRMLDSYCEQIIPLTTDSQVSGVLFVGGKYYDECCNGF